MEGVVTLKQCKEIYDKAMYGHFYWEVSKDLGITASEARRRGRKWEGRMKRAMHGGKSKCSATIKEWKEEYPVIYCVKPYTHQVIFFCPYCGRCHIHGRPDKKPERYTHRIAHCPRPDRVVDGYYLYEVDDPVLAGFCELE